MILNESGFKVLYHIAKKPAKPRPHRVDPEIGWHGFEKGEPVVFLTPNPIEVGVYHGIMGNVYAYRVPLSVIRSAGGIKRYDKASEIQIPESLWGQVEFVGLSKSEEDFKKEIHGQMILHLRLDAASEPGVNSLGNFRYFALQTPGGKIAREFRERLLNMAFQHRLEDTFNKQIALTMNRHSNLLLKKSLTPEEENDLRRVFANLLQVASAQERRWS